MINQLFKLHKSFKQFHKSIKSDASNIPKLFSNMWVFGYGSLIWKVDFPYESKLIGYIKGYNRRFYQHSTDHRGVPEKPGRVVTLIPTDDNEACVWGIAYKIKSEDVENVVNHLDYREKGGYKRKEVMFYPKNGSVPFQLTVYYGASDNFQYAGEADLNSIAKQVVSSAGPSGTNLDYVCSLAKSMREIAPNVNDEHLFALEAKVLEIIKS
ncbi:hypothetical protein AMK59_5739, partial [Oryctes borbonicus]